MKKKIAIILVLVMLMSTFTMFTAGAQDPDIKIFDMQDYIADALPRGIITDWHFRAPGSVLGTPWLINAGTGIASHYFPALGLYSLTADAWELNINNEVLNPTRGFNIVFQNTCGYMAPDNTYRLVIFGIAGSNRNIELRRTDTNEIVAVYNTGPLRDPVTFSWTFDFEIEGTYAELMAMGGINISSPRTAPGSAGLTGIQLLEVKVYGTAANANCGNCEICAFGQLSEVEGDADITITRPDPLPPFLLNPEGNVAGDLFPGALHGTGLSFGEWRFTGTPQTVGALNETSVVYGYLDVFNDPFEVSVSIGNFLRVTDGVPIFSAFSLQLTPSGNDFLAAFGGATYNPVVPKAPGVLQLVANAPVVAFSSNAVGHGYVNYQGALTFTQDRPLLGAANAVITWEISPVVNP